MKKILIFYVSRHSGHYHAAKAIEAAFGSVLGDAKIKTVNGLNYVNPILGAIVDKAYIQLIKKKPQFWGDIYDNPDVLKRTAGLRDTLSKFNLPKIKKLIETFSPDIVYCTQAFPCGMISDYKLKTGAKLPLVAVLTDHAPHSYWLHEGVDIYVVPSAATADALANKGVPRSRIKEYGIPIDPRFAIKGDKASARRELGLEGDDPVLLVMGGNQGLGALEDAARALVEEKEHRYRLILVAGFNRRLYKRLKKFAVRDARNDIRVFSFVDNIDLLMEASDLIVTKAGGMTISEAMAKGLPMIIVKPIPGHEKRNADILVEQGAAVEIKDLSSLRGAVNRMFSGEEDLNRMKQGVSALARPESAIDIAKLALQV